jgi:drug/metabolite transporter (DMT)-like permease
MRDDAHPARPAGAVRRGLLLGLGAALIWGSYLAFARAGVADGLHPEDFALLRFGVAAIVMLPYLLKTGVARLAGVGWGRAFALAIFAGPLFMLLIPAGFIFAPLPHGAVIPPASTVVCSLLMAALFLGDRPTVSRIVAVVLILIGLVCIAGSGFFSGKGGQTWLGDLMFFAGGLLWAVFTVLQQRWKIGPMQATTALSVMSILLLLPPYLIWSSFDRLLALPPAMLAAQIAIQGVLAGAVAVIAYVSAVMALGASRAAVFPAMVPGTAILIGIPLTGEWPTALQWAGIAVVTLGLLAALGVVQFRRRRAQKKP